MTILQDTVFLCDQCGHKWISKKFNRDNPPYICAKCKSIGWNKKK